MLPTYMCPGSSQWPRVQRWGRLSIYLASMNCVVSSLVSAVTTITLASVISRRPARLMDRYPAVGVSLLNGNRDDVDHGFSRQGLPATRKLSAWEACVVSPGYQRQSAQP